MSHEKALLKLAHLSPKPHTLAHTHTHSYTQFTPILTYYYSLINLPWYIHLEQFRGCPTELNFILIVIQLYSDLGVALLQD